MTRPSRFAALALVLSALLAGPAFAQDRPDAQADSTFPKAVRVDGANTPLRAGPAADSPTIVSVAMGTVLQVTGRTGEWLQVTLTPALVSDPTAPRMAYVLARLVTVVPNTLTPQANIQNIPAYAGSEAPPATASPVPAAPAVQHASDDVAIAWCVVKDFQAMPICVSASDAFRVARGVSIVVDTTFAHKAFGGGFGSLNLYDVAGGVRFGAESGPTHRPLAFGQVLVGMTRVNASDVLGDFGEVYALLVQPGVAADIPLRPTFAIRPQFDVLLAHTNGQWLRDYRFEVSAVFQLYRGSSH